MGAGMSRERYAAGIVGALVAIGITFALIPGSLSLPIAATSALLAIAIERLFFA